MPIKRKKLEIHELMYEQESYDILLNDHKERFVFFDIKKFEYNNISRTHKKMAQLNMIISIKDKLDELDKIKPLYKFSEDGTRYAFELFLADPKEWRGKGSPYLWAYIARQFSDDVLPMDKDEFIKKYMDVVNKFNIPFGKDETVVIDEFTYDGNNNGEVNGMFVKEGLDTLIERSKLYDLLKVAGNASTY